MMVKGRLVLTDRHARMGMRGNADRRCRLLKRQHLAAIHKFEPGRGRLDQRFQRPPC